VHGSERRSGRGSQQPLLQAMGLTYQHPGSGQGIEGVDLRLELGSFTVVTGRSGAGKTTLLQVLLGLVPGYAGEIQWCGTPVADPARSFAPPRAAYIAQASAARRWTLEQAMAALLAGNELWVIDDLSDALEVSEERALWDWIFCRFLFWRQGACLAVSNRRPALCRADRVVVLQEGRTVDEGRLEELLPRCAEMRRIWEADPTGPQSSRSRFLA
jgi:ATP-binding cassette subfamily B protein